MSYKNSVLENKELLETLNNINPKFCDFVTRVTGEAWGLPHIDQKTKAFICIAVDTVNRIGEGDPFSIHVKMAMEQGATYEELEELLLFLCPYVGSSKVLGYFSILNEIFKNE